MSDYIWDELSDRHKELGRKLDIAREALEYYANPEIYRNECDVLGSGEVITYIVANEEAAKEALEAMKNDTGS